jgi:hypothetical protein
MNSELKKLNIAVKKINAAGRPKGKKRKHRDDDEAQSPGKCSLVDTDGANRDQRQMRLLDQKRRSLSSRDISNSRPASRLRRMRLPGTTLSS